MIGKTEITSKYKRRCRNDVKTL